MVPEAPVILEVPQGWLPERGVLRQIGKAQWGGAAGVSPGQGRGSLVGCCLWGRTELDTTEVT